MKNNNAVRTRRMAGYYQLLELLSWRQLPVVCTVAEDIDRVLALRSALLVEARIEAPKLLRTGERRIGLAVVTAITMEGRHTLARNSRSRLRAVRPKEPALPASRPGRRSVR